MNCGDRRRLAAAVLDVVQCGGANLQPLFVFVVPLGDAGVEIPAVVVESRRVGDAADVVEALVLELAEPDDHVGHLDACVVDVVLHLDRHAAKPLHAHERVAERRVSQVADVRRLVRVDRGVLDDGLRSADRPSSTGLSSARRPSTAAYARTPRDPDRCSDSRSAPPRRGRCRRSVPSAAASSCAIARGALRSAPRQLERHRRREVAELALGRILDRQMRQRVRRELIELLKRRQQPLPQAFVNWKNHEG